MRFDSALYTKGATCSPPLLHVPLIIRDIKLTMVESRLMGWLATFTGDPSECDHSHSLDPRGLTASVHFEADMREEPTAASSPPLSRGSAEHIRSCFSGRRGEALGRDGHNSPAAGQRASPATAAPAAAQTAAPAALSPAPAASPPAGGAAAAATAAAAAGRRSRAAAASRPG